MRQLHLVRHDPDGLARDVIRFQVAAGDEVHVVLSQEAAGAGLASVPAGAVGFSIPPLQYDELVAELAWCDRVVSW
jgi:hypothetical protein